MGYLGGYQQQKNEDERSKDKVANTIHDLLLFVCITTYKKIGFKKVGHKDHYLFF